MKMSHKVIVSIILLSTAFAIGRYTSPEKIKVEVKTVEVEKVVTKVVYQKIYIKENPDGSKETTITTDTKTNSSTSSKETDSSTEQSISKKITNISILTGTELPLTNPSLVYGVSINSNLLGPVTMGAWGLSNLTFGASFGLNF